MQRKRVLDILLLDFPGDHNRCNQVVDRYEKLWKNTKSETEFMMKIYPKMIIYALKFN